MNNTRTTALWIFLFVIVMAGFAKGIFNSVSNPPWQAADEVTHFESAVLHGQHLLSSSGSEANNALQGEIIQSMSRYDFWQRIRIPSPDPIPETFAQDIFLRSAPSKLGRSPFYYTLAGLFTHAGSQDLVSMLFRLRFFNGLLALGSVVIVILSAARLFPESRWQTCWPGMFLIFHPTFWHLAWSMTLESWVVFISSIGIFFIISAHEDGISVKNIWGLFLWLVLSALTRWTLLLISLLVSIPVLLQIHRHSRMDTVRWNRRSILLIMGLGIALLLITITSSQMSLLVHEVTGGITGFRGTLVLPVRRWQQIASDLFRTFWHGFGWLTVPVPSAITVMFLAFTAWIGYGIWRSVHDRWTQRPLVIINLLLYPGIALAMAGIRAAAAEPAIQGRYLFPALPAIAILSSFAFSRSFLNNRLKKTMCIGILLWMLNLDFLSNMTGWYYDQHLKRVDRAEIIRIFKALSWHCSGIHGAILDIGTPHARIFMGDGWYADEPNAHVWMRSTASLLLPFLPESDIEIYVRAIPYQPKDVSPRTLRIHFNDQPIYENILTPGWNAIQFHVPNSSIKPECNTIQFISPLTDSPLERGESDDPRQISVGIDKIWITTSGEPDTPEREGSYWIADMSGIHCNLQSHCGILFRKDINWNVLMQTENGDRIILDRKHPRFTTNRSVIIDAFSIIGDQEWPFDLIRDGWINSGRDLPWPWNRPWIQAMVMIGYLVSLCLPMLLLMSVKK